MVTKDVGGFTVTVVSKSEHMSLDDEDREMDFRVSEAIKAAVNRAKVCKKPIARYDAASGKAYLEYPDGSRHYE